jgi:hypothetical protein
MFTYNLPPRPTRPNLQYWRTARQKSYIFVIRFDNRLTSLAQKAETGGAPKKAEAGPEGKADDATKPDRNGP